MILLLGFAFLSGLVTILTPCIWPLLPIILASSIADKKVSHHKPLGITLGLMVSFVFFTLAISSFVRLFHFDPNILRIVAVAVIGFLGLAMLIPVLSEFLETAISKISGKLLPHRQGTGLGGGFVTGLALGIVWSPCAGPILAAIATLAATGKVTLDVVLVTVAYVIGVGIPLFIFSLAGQRIFARAKFISSHTHLIQQIFGVLMILTALAIYTNYDVYLQAKLLNAFPGFNSLTNVGQNNNVTKQLDVLKGSTGQTTGLASGLFNTNSKAPDFGGATKWLNSDGPISIKDLKGKVVLVDFWTYTCINCIRTLPHVTSWYDKYHDKGFVVIGVHTPEFEFEKDTNNVLSAIKQFNIHYPVPQDNDYKIWNAFNNQYWPAEYLIDANGNIRREHFGEGEYDQTEQAIQALLKEAGGQVNTPLLDMPDQTPKTRISPETYLGSKRMEFYFPDGNTKNGDFSFTLRDDLAVNSFSLGGQWIVSDENAVAGSNAVLNYNFNANKVFLVMRPGAAGGNAAVKVLVDGKQVNILNAGTDVRDGVVKIDSDRLYNLVDLKGKTGNHLLRLEFTPGIENFAFTFG